MDIPLFSNLTVSERMFYKSINKAFILISLIHSL